MRAARSGVKQITAAVREVNSGDETAQIFHYFMFFIFIFPAAAAPYIHRVANSSEIIPSVVTFRFPVIGFTGPTQYI